MNSYRVNADVLNRPGSVESGRLVVEASDIELTAQVLGTQGWPRKIEVVDNAGSVLGEFWRSGSEGDVEELYSFSYRCRAALAALGFDTLIVLND